MTARNPSPEFRVVWPVETLRTVADGPKLRTAVVLSVTCPAETKKQVLTNGLAVALAEAGVELFALVGKDSEKLHDALDWALEEAGAEDVVTSWHDSDDLEDLSAFVAATSSASDLSRVIAVLDESTKFGKSLRDHLVNAIVADTNE